MNFKTLFDFQATDAQVNVSAQKMDPDPVVAFPGQIGEFYQGSVIDTEIIFAAEADFSATALGLDLIAFYDDQIGHSRFRTEAAGLLDDDIALDIGQPDKAPAVVILVLGESEERQQSQDRNHQDCLFHLRSPYTPG
jgi:hypothetical protein